MSELHKKNLRPLEKDGVCWNITVNITVNNTEGMTVQRSLESDGVCWNITVGDSECTELSKHEKEEPLKFPLQVVSAAPGSGNDWILWLASINSKHVIINIIIVVLVTVFLGYIAYSISTTFSYWYY